MDRADFSHCILIVDDEANVLKALRRLLRKEPYRVLTAGNAEEGMSLLTDNDVHMVISDQRMPDMSGVDFLHAVKTKHPEVLRVVLTGYTDIDSITESINKGHVFKFFLKPWDDTNLKMEIRQALKHYDLEQVNKRLGLELMEKNKQLQDINENLENLVRDRTEVLELQNQALELSHAILEYLPTPVVGVSSDGIIAMVNHSVARLYNGYQKIAVGALIQDTMLATVAEDIQSVVQSQQPCSVKLPQPEKDVQGLDIIPLPGKYKGAGAIVSFVLKNKL